jgi:hypothetical protein
MACNLLFSEVYYYAFITVAEAGLKWLVPNANKFLVSLAERIYFEVDLCRRRMRLWRTSLPISISQDDRSRGFNFGTVNQNKKRESERSNGVSDI